MQPGGVQSGLPFRVETQTQAIVIPNILPWSPRVRLERMRTRKRMAMVVGMERMGMVSRMVMEMMAVGRTLIWR